MIKILLFEMTIALLILHSCIDPNEKVSSTSDIELISAQKVHDAINNEDSLQLVDVRSEEKYKVSHLIGSQNICIENDDFDKKINSLYKDKPVYVYCKERSKSAKAAEKLKKLGFTKVYDLDGGIHSWEEKKLDLDNYNLPMP
jgi:rhodanese-related sulfurtransferase